MPSNPRSSRVSLTAAFAIVAAVLTAAIAVPAAAQLQQTPTPDAGPLKAPAPEPTPAPPPAPTPTAPGAAPPPDTTPPPPQPGTMPAVLAAAKASDWAPLDPENTLYVEVAGGRVVIALAPAFAPNHVANVKALARQGYFDGTAVLRSQENYVVQWGDPHGDDEAKAKPFGKAQRSVAAELDRAGKDLPFTRLRDGDVYAPEVGFSNGFPAARDAKSGRAWLTHCYAMVGAGRGNTADSGSGAELYVVIGHSPRHLDRNVTLLGRVVKGMELLTTLPRGTGPLGFYLEESQYVPLRSVRVAADVPAAEREALEVLRTDTPTFDQLVDSRRTRREDWFLDKAGKIELCNVPLPVRPAAAPPTKSAGS